MKRLNLKSLTNIEKFLLQLADNGIVHNHRLCQWCSHAPELELEMSLANIGLDHLGQARLWLEALIQELSAKGMNLTEDELAYFREDDEFFNLLLLEQEDEDFAYLICKMFFYDCYHQLVLQQLVNSNHNVFLPIAQKALVEVQYHVKFSKHWFQVLCQGTKESLNRMESAIDYLWQYCGEFFCPALQEEYLVKTDVLNLEQIQTTWSQEIFSILPQIDKKLDFYLPLGKQNQHTEYLGYLLAEMQVLARKHPHAQW